MVRFSSPELSCRLGIYCLQDFLFISRDNTLLLITEEGQPNPLRDAIKLRDYTAVWYLCSRIEKMDDEDGKNAIKANTDYLSSVKGDEGEEAKWIQELLTKRNFKAPTV